MKHNLSNCITKSIIGVLQLAALLLIGVTNPCASELPDLDGNGFRDAHEFMLAQMFCPSFVLPKKEADKYGINTEPEPVEIVTGMIYRKLWDVSGQYAGGTEVPTLVGENYSHLDNDNEYQSFTTPDMYNNCPNAYVKYYWKYHFDYAGPSTNCDAQGGGEETPAGWYLEYLSGSGQAGDDFPVTVYAHPFVTNGKYVIQYWLFYPFNAFLNNHEGDWEHINVEITSDDPNSAEIASVVYYFHHLYQSAEITQIEAEQQSQTDFDCYITNKTHPVVFVGGYAKEDVHGFSGAEGFSSHGSYPVHGHWNNMDPEYFFGTEVVDIDEHVDGLGKWISWADIVAETRDDILGVVLLKELGFYDYDTALGKAKSWLKADIWWGHEMVDSPGDWLVGLGKDVGNKAPRGPRWQGSWNVLHGSGGHSPWGGYASEFTYASDANWIAPVTTWTAGRDLTVSLTNGQEVSGVVKMRGTAPVEDDQIVVDWGVGAVPTEWRTDGVELLWDFGGFVDLIYARWYSRMAPEGPISLRVRTYNSGNLTSEDIEVVTVSRTILNVALDGSGDYVTIQAAMIAAESGDDVIVTVAGEYVENVELKDGVYLVANIPGVVIVGVGDNPAVRVENHNTPSRIEGVTIKHQNGEAIVDGHGISISNASPHIADCIIADNQASVGGGVKVDGDSRVEFNNCEFSQNIGGGVSIIGSEDEKPIATFDNCKFIDNEGQRGAAVTIEYPYNYPLDEAYEQPRFTNCLFDGNKSDIQTQWFGIVFVNYCDDVLFENCLFINNERSTSTWTGGVISGDFGGLIRDCTIAYNKQDVGSGNDCFAAVDRKNASRKLALDIEHTIIAFNQGPALIPYDPNNINVLITDSDIYENESCNANAPSDEEWSSGGITNNVINENPAFCDTTQGGYELYAFSPCAPGVASSTVIGAKGVGCIPGADAVVNVDSMYNNGLVLFACPEGDAVGYHVNIQLEDSVITRTIQADEFSLGFSDFDGTVYDADGVVTAVAPADSVNLFTTDISHRWFGGAGEAYLDVMLNGVVLVDSVILNVRTPDESGGPNGLPDGRVDIIDMSAFGTSLTSPPNPYVPHRDFNADSVIDIVDFSLFAEHYYHESPFPLLQPSSSEYIATSDVEVNLEFTEEFVNPSERVLAVQITLVNLDAFKAMCVSLKQESQALSFSRFESNPQYSRPIMAVVSL